MLARRARVRKDGPPITDHYSLRNAKQGSFFIDEQNIATAFPTSAGDLPPGHISVTGMYVQYQDSRKRHEETPPDGRMGWAEYFVRPFRPYTLRFSPNANEP